MNVSRRELLLYDALELVRTSKNYAFSERRPNFAVVRLLRSLHLDYRVPTTSIQFLSPRLPSDGSSFEAMDQDSPSMPNIWSVTAAL